MWLDVALVNGLGAVLALDYDIRLGESLGGVALLMLEVVCDVAYIVGFLAEFLGLEVGVEYGSALGHRVFDRDYRRQDFVVHLDEAGGLFSDMRADGGDSGYGVASIEGLVGRQNVVAQPLEAGGSAFAHVHHALGVSGEVGVGDHGQNAFERFGLRGVHVPDIGVGVRASDDVAVEQSRGVVVRAVQRASGYLVSPIVADGARANHIVGLCGQHHVSFVVNGSGHGLSLLHLHRRVLDRADDLVVAGAAA